MRSSETTLRSSHPVGIASMARRSPDEVQPRAALRSALDRARYDREVLSHRAELSGLALRLTGSRADAEDLLQDAVLRAWLFWHRFEDGTNGRAWLYRILVNVFITGYRKRRREREVLTELSSALSRVHASTSPTADVLGEGISDEVARALACLPEDFRKTLELVDLEERSYREAADALGCPVGTVMSRLHRARRAVRRELTRYAATMGYEHPPHREPDATPRLEAA